MKQLSKSLEEISLLSKKDTPVIMPSVVLGYPTLEQSISIVKTLDKLNLFAIEIQVPFSEPMVDGEEVMYANDIALKNKVNLSKTLKVIKESLNKVNSTLIIRSYLNPVYVYKNGIEDFFKDLKSSGLDSLVVLDIPIEETDLNYWSLSKEYEILSIPFVSNLTSNSKLKLIKNLYEDKFVYCLCAYLKEGKRCVLPSLVKSYLKRVKAQTNSKIAVDINVTKKAQVDAFRGYADIIRVGAPLMELIINTPKTRRKKEIVNFINSLKN